MSQNCRKHPGVALIGVKKGWHCEECDRTLAAEEIVEADSSADLRASPSPLAAGLDHVPFPVAYPLSFARDATLAPGERVDNTIFAAYQAMRVTGLVLLADYFACDTPSARLAPAIRGLRIPHWGEWTLLCDQLSSFWSGHFPEEKPERPSRFEALVEGWRAASRRKGKGDPVWEKAFAGLPGMGGPAISPNDALWRARNDRAHRMATRTDDRGADEVLLAQLLSLVEMEVAKLFPPGGLEFVRVVEREGLRSIRLAGPHRDLRFEEEPLGTEWSGLFEKTDVAALCGSAGVPVHPLIVAMGEEGRAGSGASIPAGGLMEPVALVDGSSPRRIVVLGVRGWAERPDLVPPFLEALAAKKTDFGLGRDETKRWSIADWAGTTAREAVEAMRGRKYFPECYLERRGVDDVVEILAERGGRGLLLLGEAGSGKSSLLARMVERLTTATEEDGRPEVRDVVLFLSGRSAFSGDAARPARELLCDAVLARAGVRSGAFTDLADFCVRLAETAKEDTTADRRVWLLLDAINEADRFTDLVAALDAFLPGLALILDKSLQIW